MKTTHRFGFLLALGAFVLCLPSSVAMAQALVYESDLPPQDTHTSFCSHNTNGVRGCEISDPFSVTEKRLATAVTMFGLGCNSEDAHHFIFSYALAESGARDIITSSIGRPQVDCLPHPPAEYDLPATFPFPPTTLVPGKDYVVVLRAEGHPPARAYWGVGSDHRPSFKIWTSLELEDMWQTDSDGSTVLGEGGTAATDTVVLRGLPMRDVESGLQSGVRLQAEVRRFSEKFTGEPTTESHFVSPGQEAGITLSGLEDGAYHWRMRVVDEFDHVSDWHELGAEGNADFVVFTGSRPETLPIPNPSCRAPVTFVSHVPAVLQAANFWTSCHGSGRCNQPAQSRLMDHEGNVLAASDILFSGFDYTANAHDVNYTTNFSGVNRITLQPGKVYSFQNFILDGNDCTSGPYHPNTAHLILSTDELPEPSDSGREPVVIVPGLLGSVLRNAEDGGEIWPNADAIFSSKDDVHLDKLGLAEDGSEIPGQEAALGGMIHSETLSVLGLDIERVVYGELIKEFTDRGYSRGADLFEVPYDWRMDLRDEVARLEATVDAARQISPTGKINIVAHSMGGLLVKQYLLEAGDVPFVGKVVLMGTPQLGAPAMFKALNYGDNLGFTFPVINKDLLSPERIKAIAQNMPGAYELLPSRSYVEISGSYVRDFRNGAVRNLSFDEVSELMVNDGRNSGLLSTAQDFHDGIDDKALAGTEVHNVVACGNNATIGEFRLYDKGRIDITSTNGDGTVPIVSAMRLADGYSNYFVSSPKTGIDHAGMVKDARVTDVAGDIIEGPEMDLSEGVSRSLSDCFPQETASETSSFRFSLHGPAELHVYDAEGRHTGISRDGIELGIPGSSYTDLAGNAFVFLPPAEDAYRAEIKGLAAGEFSLEAALMQGVDVETSTNYLGIEIDKDETAQALFSSAAAAPDLGLDRDGDGAFEDALPASSALAGAAAMDVLPPEIEAFGIPTEALAPGEEFSLTFNAEDDLSGIVLLSAAIDGKPVESGDQIALPEAGSYGLVIEAVDKAGNPSVFRAEIIVEEPDPAGDESDPEEQDQNPADDNDDSNKSDKDKGESGKDKKEKGLSPKPEGQVLPAEKVCLEVPDAPLGRGRGNDPAQVVLLQAFLNREFGLNIPLTGFFGPITELAVKAFQLTHFEDVLRPWSLYAPTGFVGRTTLAKISSLACA